MQNQRKTSTTSGTNESKPAEKDTDDVKDGGDSIPPPPTTTTTSEPKNASYCIYFDVKHVQNSTISATTKESEHSEKGKNESKPPPTSDGSSDDDDDENEEEFKLKSPPRLSEQKSSTGPILQTIPNKRPSTKEASKSSNGSIGTSSSGSTGSGTTGTTTSGSGTTGSASDTSNSKTSSGPSLSTTSTASTAVSGNFKKELLPSASSSSSSGTPKKKNSHRKKIIATTPASVVSSSSPQPSSPSVPSSSKKSSIRISACSTASLPDFAKANNSPPKNDSVYFNPSNPALNNNNGSNKNNNVQNGSTFPKLTSPNVRTFQAHKNDSVYFGVPTDAATPANTSGYLKPRKRDGSESKECNDKNTIAPKSNAAKNDSVYFAPK
uniref:Uncharacterized protein n=1 Tax=Panagrolaimus davidi TaxID=227884 RepID=A0A914PTK4_9BILA